MKNDLKCYNLLSKNKTKDIILLSQACSKNDEIEHVIKQKYEAFRKKIPYSQFIQLTSSYLLDTKKRYFSVVEKYAYDIAMFQLAEKNIPYSDDIYIQIGFKTGKTDKIRELHLDCFMNEENNNIIYLSSILYLNNSIRPTIFTNVTMKSNDLKNLENETDIAFSFPNAMKLISFNGKNYFHGYHDIFPEVIEGDDRPMIILKVWDCKIHPLISYFDATEFSLENTIPRDGGPIIDIQCYTNDKIISLPDDKLINRTFFENLLFYPKKDLCFRFSKFIDIDNINTNDVIIFRKGMGRYADSVDLIYIFFAFAILMLLHLFAFNDQLGWLQETDLFLPKQLLP
jgi:hypothetical protein